MPLAPVASPDGLLLYVLNGVSYQIRAGDLLQVAGVPTTRQVIAGTGLSGGGQLSSNVTLSVAPGGVSDTELSATGATPGSYGSITQVPVIQVNSKGRITSVSGVAINLASKVDITTQVIAGIGLSGGGALASNVTLNADVSNLAPLAVNTTGAAGTSQELSRADHRHPAINLGADAEVDGNLGIGNGGLGNSIVPAVGALLWCGADRFYLGPVGLNGQVLISKGAGSYAWGNVVTQSDQPANFVYAGPATGPDAAVSFRLLVNADIPVALSGKTLDGSPIGATTASTVRGTTITATTEFSGPGTGLTGTAGSLSIGGNAATATNAVNAAQITVTDENTNVTRYLTFVSGISGSNGLFVDGSVSPLTYNPSSNLIGANISGNAATATNATLATRSTNLAGGNASQIPYQTALDTTGFIPNGSTGQVLTSQGAGVPVWSGLDGGTF